VAEAEKAIGLPPSKDFLDQMIDGVKMYADNSESTLWRC
jgi:hypothetical protein